MFLAIFPLVAKILDAITNFLMGWIIERTKTSQGKARPYLFVSALILPLCGILMYTVPQASQNVQAAWIMIGLIHHYQVFDPCGCIAMYLLATPAYSGMFANALEDSCPENSIITKDRLHPDIRYIMDHIDEKDERVIHKNLQINLYDSIKCIEFYNIRKKITI